MLFVVNANSELQYDSGSLSVIDLNKIETTADAWEANETAATGCHTDPGALQTLICLQPPYLNLAAGIRIGNFGTFIGVQDLGNGGIRLILPVRGDPSITWADWDGTKFSCDDAGATNGLCDDTHRLTVLRNDTTNTLPTIPPEPFNVFVDSTSQYAVVSHFTTGSVSLVDSQVGSSPIISDIITGLFEANATTGLTGASAIGGRDPGPDDLLYLTSTSEDRVQMLAAYRDPLSHSPSLITSNFFFLGKVAGVNAGGSSDSRDIKFTQGGDRMYLANRNPPSLQIYDTSNGPTGFPNNTLVAITDLCRQVSSMTVFDAGDGERAYVTCFDDGQIYVVNPTGGSSVEAIITVGRGPFSVAVSATRNKLYVSNFLENTVAVVELDPTSPKRYQVVMRLGEPSVVEEPQ